jgi:DivIVA domain-containing protein
MAADKYNTDLLPLLSDDEPHFDVAMRGYDKRQVDDYVARAEAEIAEMQAARDAALASSADRAAQLANREAHIESLRRQAAKGSESLSAGTVSDRIRDMLQLATDEAAQTRRAAEEEAERVISAARADAERVRGDAAAEQQRLTAAARQRTAEAEQKLAQARLQATSELDAARTEISRLDEAATTERGRLDSGAAAARSQADEQSAAQRAQADEDFAITLRGRRRSAEQQAAAEHEEARAVATAMVENAQAEVARIAAQRDEIHAALAELYGRLATIVTGNSAT